MSISALKKKAQNIISHKSYNNSELIFALYEYIVKNGKVPFNMNKAKRMYRNHEIKILEHETDKIPTKTISTKKQYNHWVKYGN